MTHLRVVAVLLSAGALACGFNSQGQDTGESPAPPAVVQPVPAPSATRISAEEIAASGGATAYDVVDKLHHRWFKDQLSGKEVTVYVDTSPIEGGAQALRDFPSNTVAGLEYYDGQTAVQRWGVDRTGGVIVVVRSRN